MSYLSVAQSLTPKEIAGVLEERDRLKNELAWYKRQIYGRKSEKRIETDPSIMGDLFAQLDLPLPKDSEPAQEGETTDVQSHKRKKRKLANSPDDSGLQFSDDVPVKTISLDSEEYKQNPDQFEIIGEKVTYRLAQQRHTYGILKYVRAIYKRKADKHIVNTPAPENVLDTRFRSF
ncbi:MAG: transposase [Bacteroidetes bacterium]|nr:transposase [Bacteroidota bacterium]